MKNGDLVELTADLFDDGESGTRSPWCIAREGDSLTVVSTRENYVLCELDRGGLIWLSPSDFMTPNI